MALRSKIKNFREMNSVGADLLKGVYPDFVYRNRFNFDQIPCFCFHDAKPGEIEPMLKYLKENSYRTLRLEEFGAAVHGKFDLKQQKSVFLTFDDGVGSIWAVLYPLLKRYRFSATVFIVPGRIRFRSCYLPTLEDYWASNVPLDAIVSRDRSEEPFATWEEIIEMHESGVIDFDSHTLDHSLIFTSPRIVTFVNPAVLNEFHPFEFPRIRYGANSVVTVNQLGAPLFETASRMSGICRFKDPIQLRDDCIRFVADRGGELFFRSPAWQEELMRFTSSHPDYRPGEALYESLEETREAINYQIKRAKELIEEMLPQKKSTHLCYPWGIGSELACEVSQEIGYQYSYWTHSRECCRTIRVGQNPFYLDRLGPDFFYSLPGQGRKSFGDVLKKKLFRRLREGSPYLSH